MPAYLQNSVVGFSAYELIDFSNPNPREYPELISSNGSLQGTTIYGRGFTKRWFSRYKERHEAQQAWLRQIEFAREINGHTG